MPSTKLTTRYFKVRTIVAGLEGIFIVCSGSGVGSLPRFLELTIKISQSSVVIIHLAY
jgi:hypothetical protein